MKSTVTWLAIISVLSCFVLALLATGCSQPSQATTTPQTIEESIESEGSCGVEPDLSISHAPAVNEEAELTFTIDTIYDDPMVSITRAWIEFERYDPALHYQSGRGDTKAKFLDRLERNYPSVSYYGTIKDQLIYQLESMVPQEEVLVSGELSWEGAPPVKKGDRIELSATVRFPEEGEWLVNAWWEGKEIPTRVCDHLKLTISQDSGVLGWQRIYYGPGGNYPNEDYPVGVVLWISQVPLVGEPSELTVIIRAIRDIAEAEVYLDCYRMEGTTYDWKRIRVPFEDIHVGGDLTWQGSLKKDVPVTLTGTVIFPEEGNWSIGAWAHPAPEGALSGGHMYGLSLHVGKEKSRVGWTQDYRRHPPGSPPAHTIPDETSSSSNPEIGGHSACTSL